MRMWRGVKDGFLQKREFAALTVGNVLLLLGNMAITVGTFDGIPVDMAMGIPDAFCIMIVIGMSPMIREYREAATKRTEVFCLVIPAALSLMYMLACENFVENFFRVKEASDRAYLVTILTLLFYIIMQLGTRKLMSKLFISETELQVIQMNEFQKKLKETTEIAHVEELLKTTTKHWLGAEFAEIMLLDKAAGSFMTENHLPDGMLIIRRENAFVQYMAELRRCISLSSLQWDSLDIACRQKVRELRQRRIEMVLPMFLGEEFYGILVISGRRKAYQTVERHKIEVLMEAGMDAMKKMKAERA